jgi:lipoprotein NlpD
MKFLCFFLMTLFLAACNSNPPAPVIDRLPATKKTSSTKPAAQSKTNTSRPTYKAGDWRPDSYIVKKGDTLFSVGLEHGYDYKEIAQANNISAPYTIKVGQTLKFTALKDKPNVENKIENKPNEDGVTTYPINNDGPNTSTPVVPSVVAISEPKAIREPYSEEAFKTPLPAAKPTEKPTLTSKPVATKPIAETKPETKVDAKPETKSSAESAEDMDWSWPTKGQVIANFNDAGNKGIDIAGKSGQDIEAAASGKVIYSGSDLRGYGKLVIIKHNSTYLSVYAHNSKIVVKEGQQIGRGEKIAEMGNTDSNTVKLHFEIRRQGKSVDPSKYLAAN